MREGKDTFYDAKRYIGERYQHYIADVHRLTMGRPISCWESEYMQRIAESAEGIEIKLDARMADTGNIYFEVSERTLQTHGYVHGGIRRHGQTVLIIGDYLHAHMISTDGLYDTLVGLVALGHAREVDTGTSQGIVVGIRDIKMLPQYRGDLIDTAMTRNIETLNGLIAWGRKEQTTARAELARLDSRRA